MLRIARVWLRISNRIMISSNKKMWKDVVLPDGEGAFKNVNYAGDGDFYRGFDLFHAYGQRRKKLVIDIHGGSYIYGTRINNFRFAELFLNRGYDVLLPDYRLVKKKTGVSVKDQISDLLLMLSYLKEHKKELGIEEDDIALMGDSAGGHLALFLQLVLDDSKLQQEWGIDLSGLESKAVVCICPVYDLEVLIKKNILSKRSKKYLFGECCLEPGFSEKISPRSHIASLNHPIFVSTCRNDFLNFKVAGAHSDCLKADLEKEGKEFEFINLETKKKSIAHIHNVLNREAKESKEVNQAIYDFLEKHLG